MLTFYVATLHKHAGVFWAGVHDFPGINTAAPTRQEALVLLTEFAADQVAAYVEAGHPIPLATDLDDVDSPDDERALIPVTLPG